MFKTVTFEPQYQDWCDTPEEAIGKLVYYAFEDHVAVVELKKVYRIKRDIEEVSVEEATQEALDKYNDIVRGYSSEIDPAETPEENT